MPTWRIPLSAHVCTTDDAPATARADLYLEIAPDLYAKAQVLLAKYRMLKPGTYREALWEGYYALEEEARRALKNVIGLGALLHYDCPRALAAAQASNELRRKKMRQQAEVATC